MARTPVTLFRCKRLLPLLAVVLLLPGCINIFTIAGKMLKGDPEVVSAFQRQTGKSLQKGDASIAVVCDAPASILQGYDSLAFDLQERLFQRMKLRGLATADVDEVTRLLEESGGGFSPVAVARGMDVAYIVHVQIESFRTDEPGSPGLRRGRAHGIVRAFHVRGERNTPERHVVEVFRNEFLTEYPKNHPLAADQASDLTFQRNFLDELAEDVGRRFYNISVADVL